MAKEIEQAAAHRLREAARPSITYPQNLPVSQKNSDILLIRDHQVADRAGETGSGKTTQLPKISVRNWDAELAILIDIPAAPAARTDANRIAEELKRSPRLHRLCSFQRSCQ